MRAEYALKWQNMFLASGRSWITHKTLFAGDSPDEKYVNKKHPSTYLNSAGFLNKYLTKH